MYNDLAIKCIEQINHNKTALVDLCEKIIRKDSDKLQNKFPLELRLNEFIDYISIENNSITVKMNGKYNIKLSQLYIDDLITLTNYLIK